VKQSYSGPKSRPITKTTKTNTTLTSAQYLIAYPLLPLSRSSSSSFHLLAPAPHQQVIQLRRHLHVCVPNLSHVLYRTCGPALSYCLVKTMLSQLLRYEMLTLLVTNSRELHLPRYGQFTTPLEDKSKTHSEYVACTSCVYCTRCIRCMRLACKCTIIFCGVLVHVSLL
jgi:hypothetical protein